MFLFGTLVILTRKTVLSNGYYEINMTSFYGRWPGTTWRRGLQDVRFDRSSALRALTLQDPVGGMQGRPGGAPCPQTLPHVALVSAPHARARKRGGYPRAGATGQRRHQPSTQDVKNGVRTFIAGS